MVDYCGPSERYLNRLVPGQDTFREACRAHDADYLHGVDRAEADGAFLRRMLDASEHMGHRALAYTYWALCRVFGGIFYRH